MTAADARARALADGLTPDAYRAAWQARLATSLAGLTPDERRTFHYRRYNAQRTAGVEAAYAPSDALRQAVAGIGEAQTWLVLTEDWCVDSAFTLPVIEAAAALTDRVALRVLPRDAHPDVMDAYLTNGARAIPLLVAFGPDGTERFRWGPKPAALTRLRAEAAAAGVDKSDLTKRALAWYEAGGWAEADAELAARIAGS